MYVLDTNVVSELRKARVGKADQRVVAWAEAVDAEQLFITATIALELEAGVLLVEHRDRAQGAVMRDWLENRVWPAFQGRVLPIDFEVARQCARMHVPDRRGERNALIAATAIVHGMIVVTRNVKDFAPTGVRVLDPWTPSDPRATGKPAR